MKKALLPILILIGLCACQKDFNELEDTEQRYVSFSFSPNGCLSSVLVATENSFSECTLSQLDSEHKLRIEGYCYNLNDSLIDKTAGFIDLQEEITLRFKHLHRDSTYHFRFIADIVQYNSDIDYFETWYQLGTYRLNTFYLTSFEHNEHAERNLLLAADSTLSPANQTVVLTLRPVTYNGYCIFTHLEGIDKLDGYVKKCQSFYIKTMRIISSAQNPYEFHPSTEESFVLPITTSLVDNLITLKVQVTTVTGQNAKTLRINDREHRPFVATINCQTLSLENLTLYNPKP